VNEQIQVRPIEVGRVGRIPVKNLWLLMLYASDLFRTAGSRNVGLEESPDELPDLIAEILAHAVEQRRRRQLSASFQARQGVINRVRGRINVLATERRQLLARGLVSCRFDELTVDTPRNRFVRAALESIARIVRRREVAHRCRSLAAMLKEQGVKGYAPSRHEMNIVQFSRNDSDDRYMVAAAKLAFDLCLPTEEIGSAYLSIPDREAAWVRRLFERAVGGFYAVVLEPKGWRVRCGKILDWQVEGKTSGIDRILPWKIRSPDRRGHEVYFDRNLGVAPGRDSKERIRLSDLQLSSVPSRGRR
jgi:5-methylcytosine-specific restriction enzyme subunit McrC